MKLIEHNSRILFKVSDNKTSEEIKDIIKNKIENNTYEEDIKFIPQLEDIEYLTGFSINVSKYADGDTINIYGDNGLLELDIIDVKTIKELK
jgi:hypothetical protein|tara:strand:+ start:616 stop:891 length:276 start_codon:yes stop_codon:yes gene_type:complete